MKGDTSAFGYGVPTIAEEPSIDDAIAMAQRILRQQRQMRSGKIAKGGNAGEIDFELMTLELIVRTLKECR